ncbi:MAG: hypothetical protein HPY66_1550 [Firmicutes bacterium]|nr:hypothetical protein [Bacillota bacterium]
MGRMRILMVDDDQNFLDVYSKILRRSKYMVECCTDADRGMKLLQESDIDLVVTDMVMPGMNGLEFITRIKELCPLIPVIVITGQGTIENAVEAMKIGAFSYLVKPVNIDELLLETSKAAEFLRICRDNALLKDEIAGNDDYFIGDSDKILELKKIIPVVAASDSTVLITGESGTGKELVAKLIHQKSGRKDRPMVKVNCASFARTILESELFGHERGAFTGANYTKKGRFEMADGSTLFLDEIGDISPNIQVKLLRVLQEKEFERVGGTRPISADFRLICATNRDLKEEIAKGRFREDLYYRLNVIPLHLPPLSERAEDIPALIQYFSRKFAEEMGKEKVSLTREALHAMVSYRWPGNIRELKNIIERLTVFSKGFPFGVKDLPGEIINGADGKRDIKLLKYAKEEFERAFIKEALEKNEWNITKAAEKIGIARKNLQDKIKKYGLK